MNIVKKYCRTVLDLLFFLVLFCCTSCDQEKGYIDDMSEFDAVFIDSCVCDTGVNDIRVDAFTDVSSNSLNEWSGSGYVHAIVNGQRVKEEPFEFRLKNREWENPNSRPIYFAYGGTIYRNTVDYIGVQVEKEFGIVFGDNEFNVTVFHYDGHNVVYEKKYVMSGFLSERDVTISGYVQHPAVEGEFQLLVYAED